MLKSDGTELAIEHGLELAETSGATVHALYVIEPIYATDYGGDQVLEALAEEGERATAAVAAKGNERGVPVETDVRRGPPHGEILEYASDVDTDLIVLGRRGTSTLPEAVFGSTADRVTRLSDTSVLLVSDAGET